jgi:hypothetical protein
MLVRRIAAVLALATVPAGASAQHATAAPPSRTAPPEAQQFTFLIGQWDLAVKVPAIGLAQKIHGIPKLVGSWKAWRALDGLGIEDELRITDEAGNPVGLGASLRVFDRAAKHWSITTVDGYTARSTTSTAEWRDGAMTMSSQGTDAEGKPFLSRTRFFDITPQSFHYRQERSFDDGNKWNESLSIDAKRVAATATH